MSSLVSLVRDIDLAENVEAGVADPEYVAGKADEFMYRSVWSGSPSIHYLGSICLDLLWKVTNQMLGSVDEPQ